MPLLTETYFLQNMGRVLLASLLQFSILYLVYIILKNTLLKKISARADYLVLLVALLLGTTLFVYGLVNSFSSSQPPATLSFIPQESGWYHLLNPVLHWLAMLYIVIGSLRTLVFLRHVLAPHKKQFHEPVQLAADFAEYLETFCAHIRLNMPRIVFSRKAVTPFVTGIFRSAIIIPASFQHQFTPQEMEAVILHEIAHIKRYDLLVNLLVLCCAQLLFFNPFAALLLRRLRIQRELACDDWVLAREVQPQHYATALYKAAKQQMVPAWQLAMGAQSGELYHRIERLFSPNRHQHPYKAKLAPFALLVLCLPLLLKQPGATKTLLPVSSPLVRSEQTAPPIIKNNIAVATPGNSTPALSKTLRKQPVIKRQPRIQPAGSNQPAANPVFEEPIAVIAVSNKASYLPLLAYSSNGLKRTGDILIRYTDSVNVFTEQISRAQIEELTATQMERTLNSMAQGVYELANKSDFTLVMESPVVPVNVTVDGDKNLFYAQTKLVQKTMYDAYFRQWKIQFTIMNGDQQLGSRFITIHQKKKLESARL